MVLEHGKFSEEEAEHIRSKFSLTTLRRLLESKEVLPLLGLAVVGKELRTTIPGNELMKPLKRIVRDIAEKRVDSRSFNKKEQMITYVQGFPKSDTPSLSKRVAEKPVEAIQKAEFSKVDTTSTRRKKITSERLQVVPKGCNINVTDNRIAEIYGELRKLKLNDARNAIAVLLRVFLEMSVDHFLETNGGDVTFKPAGGPVRYKKLDKKLTEVVDMLVSGGVPRAHFASVIRALSVENSPMNIDLWHRYVHDRYATPSPGELTAAWDQAQPLFEKIWP